MGLHGALRNNEARLAYCTMYLRKVCYSASLASLSSEHGLEVEHRVVRAFLSALGYNSNVPCSVTFALSDIGRVCLISTNTELGVQCILALIRNLKESDTVGPLITILL